MQYAILCYHDEKVTCAWTKEEDDAVMVKLGVVMDRLIAAVVGNRRATGPSFPCLVTLRKDREPALIIDGPFAETKEQLLGFYVVDCASLEEVLEIAGDLGRANPGGAYEIRPIGFFEPGKMAP